MTKTAEIKVMAVEVILCPAGKRGGARPQSRGDLGAGKGLGVWEPGYVCKDEAESNSHGALDEFGGRGSPTISGAHRAPDMGNGLG